MEFLSTRLRRRKCNRLKCGSLREKMKFWRWRETSRQQQRAELHRRLLQRVIEPLRRFAARDQSSLQDDVDPGDVVSPYVANGNRQRTKARFHHLARECESRF